MILSIAITAHNEGLLLHKAIQSVRNSLSFAAIDDYEILLHIDNGTPEMMSYVNSSSFCRDKVKIFENKFGDLGDSRNYCIDHAAGKYIFFLDADDLISENFLKVAIETLENNDNVLVHAESCLSFEDSGKYRCLWKLISSGTKESDAFNLFEKNMWISSVIGKRGIFVNHKYTKIQDGYGYEDFVFNIETINSGIKHLVAPGTAQFYRKSDSSLLAQSEANHVAQRYSSLFDFFFWKNFDAGLVERSNDSKTAKRDKVKRAVRSVYVNARKNAFLNAFITPAATVAKRVTGTKFIKPQKVDDSLLHQWKIISKIEPQLYPTKNSVNNLNRYSSSKNNLASEAYLKIASEATFQKADYIFIVPWVAVGGADKVLIHYLNALKELHPEWKIAVITTLPAKNEWKSKLPDNTHLFDYGNAAKDLYDSVERDVLFTRLIIQLQAKTLHIINSEYGYRWAYNHSLLIKKNYNLRLSLFCHDIIPNTKGEGVFDYADPLARRISPCVKRIFTDNDAIIGVLTNKYGFNRDIIKTHFQPSEMKIEKPVLRKSKKINILWASRVSAQKRPELLLEIANMLDPNLYHIDMYGKMEVSYGKDFADNVSSLDYRGSFNGIDSIDVSKYDCFLYTSYIDGLPNTILEIASKGLPIIASDAGGVKDFIKNKKTGMLVSSDEPTAYVEALEFIRKNPEKSKELAENAIKLIKKQHSWKAFIESVKDDF